MNPFKGNINNIDGAIWLDEWQSFMGPRFRELVYDLFSGHGVKLIVLAQSLTLPKEEKLLWPYLVNTRCRYYVKRKCPSLPLCSKKGLIEGLLSCFSGASLLEHPYHVPDLAGAELLIPFDIYHYSHLISIARDFEIIAVLGPSWTYWRDPLLWLLGGHQRSNLVGSAGENKSRRPINQESSLSRSSPDWRISFKKWQKGVHSLLRWTRGRQKNEALHPRAGPHDQG